MIETASTSTAATSRAAGSPGKDRHAGRDGASLGGLLRSYRRRLAGTYALLNVENLLRLAQPFVLGLAIDGLLKSSYIGLVLFVCQHLAHLLVASVRRVVDTRTFADIYAGVASSLVVKQRNRRVDVSRVAARSALSRSYVDFFEQSVPMMVRAGYSVAGALVMLIWYDWTLILFCLVLIIPAVLLNAAYGRKTLGLAGGLHDRFEQEVDVIARGDVEEVRRHFDAAAHWRIRLSDAEAINFGLMELFVLGVMAATLVHYCTLSGPRPGDIFAVFRYVTMFIIGVDAVPKVVQQVSHLRDISLRLRTQTG